jgi:hypothetical protein
LRHNRSSRVNDEKWEENMKFILPIAVIFALLGGAFGAQAQTKLPRSEETGERPSGAG